MSKRSEARDNHVHYQLRNWGAFINDQWQDGPREQPNGASWMEQVTDRVTETDADEVVVIDPTAAHRVQWSMTQCKKNDVETFWILTWFYRDGYDLGKLRQARNRFWRWM